MSEFKDFLIAERKKKGWSKWRLYQESGVSYPTIRNGVVFGIVIWVIIISGGMYLIKDVFRFIFNS